MQGLHAPQQAHVVGRCLSETKAEVIPIEIVKKMSTHITLEDGRTLVLSNGQFDLIIEAVAQALESGLETVPHLASWLLEQRCIILGPGIGYLDLREMSPVAKRNFRNMCHHIHSAGADSAPSVKDESADLLAPLIDELVEMWASLDRGEAPEARTSPYWRVSPPLFYRKVGPGW